MNKPIPFTVNGTVTNIEEEKIINNNSGKKFAKQIITLETIDNQVLFLEVRNEKIKDIELKNILIHDYVKVSFLLKGNVKNEKRYNNILLQSIEKTNW
jgi:hypothetical protein